MMLQLGAWSAVTAMMLTAEAAAAARPLHHVCPMIERTRALYRPEDFGHGGTRGPEWFQMNWEPYISCMAERRVGTFGDGGKWSCDPDCMLRKGECVVYSIGSNNEFSFEQDMVARGCEVHTFDHTVAAPQPPAGVTFHRDGLGVATDAPPMRSLGNITASLGHSTVDVLKMDIEGGEYRVLLDPETIATLKTKVVQLLIEFHWGWGVSASSPRTTIERVAKLLTDAGLLVFHKEPNIQFSDGSCIEYALLNVNLAARR